MSMTVQVITNLTGQARGVNKYRWLYTRHDKDGAMALISKVAQAASESETA